MAESVAEEAKVSVENEEKRKENQSLNESLPFWPLKGVCLCCERYLYDIITESEHRLGKDIRAKFISAGDERRGKSFNLVE